MRTVRFGVVFVALMLTGSGTLAAEPALLLVEETGLQSTARLQAAGLEVVHQGAEVLLVLADRAGQDYLATLGLSWQLVDPVPAGKDHFIATLRHRDQIGRLEELAAVLWHQDREAVIAFPSDQAADQVAGVAAEGIEVARVFHRPVRPFSPLVPLRAPAVIDPDPAVQDLVNAVSVFNIDATVQRLQDFVTRYCEHDSCYAAAQWIAGQFTAAGIDSVVFQTISPSYAPNVVAVIPGASEPDKTIVIGGHYDSLTGNYNDCPGADDNASGTACVLEVARVLASHTFEYTLKFVAFGAEEIGLEGSEVFADAAAAAGEDIVAAVAVDMIGYLESGDVMDLDIIDNAASQWIRDLVFDVADAYVPDLPIVDGSLPFGASSDHASFWNAGYQAILFFEDTGDYSPYIHTNNDIVGLSYNSSIMAMRSVKVAAGLIATLARPFRVAIAHTPLSNTPDSVNPYRVTALITAAGTLNPAALEVYYTTGTGFSPLSLAPTGVPDEFEAFLPAQPPGTFVDYYLAAQDTEGNQAFHPAGAPATTHRFFVGPLTTEAAYDFEVAQGWTAGAPGDDATTGIWERVDPNGTWNVGQPVQPEDDHTPDPGSQCWVTGNAPPGSGYGDNDVDGGHTTLLSPLFDLTSFDHVWVAYHRWFTNDQGNNPGEDAWRVDVSGDGGSNWVSLEYTLTSAASWTRVERYLPDVIGLSDQVQFRFVAEDIGGGSIVEAGVDDFELLVYEQPTDVASDPVTAVDRVALSAPAPNPFNPLTNIRFRVPAPTRPVSLAIYDLAGRRVAILLDKEPLAGDQAVAWRGQDDSGREVAAGAYFARLAVDGRVLTKKLMLVR